MIAMAYDMQEHTVLRPVFFTKATSDRIEIARPKNSCNSPKTSMPERAHSE